MAPPYKPLSVRKGEPVVFFSELDELPGVAARDADPSGRIDAERFAAWALDQCSPRGREVIALRFGIGRGRQIEQRELERIRLAVLLLGGYAGMTSDEISGLPACRVFRFGRKYVAPRGKP